ncbi:hypothetical protein Anapl_02514 [Anas platyrhynchos]|uniref:Uncharacterized protein n=1 Tax=Anas platyrhynchos TaxID=8839 RepID=R0L4X4_ANAPL|nr:hypothetical protein Anapl_02514 [Anas platyrhynchos]
MALGARRLDLRGAPMLLHLGQRPGALQAAGCVHARDTQNAAVCVKAERDFTDPAKHAVVELKKIEVSKSMKSRVQMTLIFSVLLEELHVAAALQLSPDHFNGASRNTSASASACTIQVGAQGKKELLPEMKLGTCFPSFLFYGRRVDRATPGRKLQLEASPAVRGQPAEGQGLMEELQDSSMPTAAGGPAGKEDAAQLIHCRKLVGCNQHTENLHRGISTERTITCLKGRQSALAALEVVHSTEQLLSLITEALPAFLLKKIHNEKQQQFLKAVNRKKMTKIQVGFNPFSEAEFTMELCAKKWKRLLLSKIHLPLRTYRTFILVFTQGEKKVVHIECNMGREGECSKVHNIDDEWIL